MDSRAALPLPPGMVPSSSREDITALGDLDTAEQEGKDILKEVSLDKRDTNGTEEEENEVSGVPDMTGKKLYAWGSPEYGMEEAQSKSSDGRKASVTTETLNKSTMSPFISTPSAQGQKKYLVPSVQQDQVTPKRVLSPLKRFHRVAPTPSPGGQVGPSGGKGALDRQTSEDCTPLKSSSATLLDQRNEQSANTGKERKDGSGSAPIKRKQKIQGKGRDIQQIVPLEPRVIIKSKDEGTVKDLEAKANIPTYSTVVKKKPQSPPAAYNEPSSLTIVPTLEAYEPEPPLETSIVISNRETMSPEPLHISEVMENDYTTTPDPLYSTVEEVDAYQPSEDAYNPALVKQLKKHDDRGTVQLLSIKGLQEKDLPTSETMSFPQGSSADMHPLHYAAANGNKKALAEIISVLPILQDTVEMVLGTENLVKREGIDVVDSEGRTPLMHAVHNDHLQAVKMLAEAGANVNQPASDGSSSLHQAAYNGRIEMVALLLSLGANGLMEDSEKRTPLHWATNNIDSKCIDILLDKVPGLDVNIRDGALMTPLMWAAFHGRTDHVRLLLEKGADPSIKDMDGMTAVHWSVQRHEVQALQILINAESVQYVDHKGKTVMHQAAEQGSAKAVSLVKAVKPTSVNDLDENGRTPLHWATACENPEAIRALLHHGADPNIRDHSGKTALEYAIEKGHHYCGLILTKTEGSESSESYHSILMYGSAPTTMGARALKNLQEGQALNPEDIKKALSQEQVMQILTVCTGSWIYKFTNNGKGPLHPRYFWVNPSNIKMCWAKNRDANPKNTKSDTLVGIRSSASPVIYGRKDFDPIDKHKYAFTIFTSNRVLDAVAVSSEDYKLWLNGLQLVLHLGSVNVTRLMSLIQKTSGGDARPIP